MLIDLFAAIVYCSGYLSNGEDMSKIAENIFQIRESMAKAAADRSVKLLAVSKTFSVEAIAQAIKAGQLAFGENYAQEGAKKISYFKEHYPDVPLEWHFIGPLQSNKTKLVAEHFQWVESIDRLKIAQRLNEQRPVDLPPLNVLVEINIDEESTKSGIMVGELEALLAELIKLPRLKLRGLMCIPKAQADDLHRRAVFKEMRALFDACVARGYKLDTLSMGMSADYICAIEEGSTLVRVGSAIFGARDYSKKLERK